MPSSAESEMRCVFPDIGITATVFLASRSSTETDPAPTLAVYPRRPSRVIASMCDSAAPVGTLPATFSVRGSITAIELSSSVVTYSSPSFGPNTAPCGRTPLPKSILPTTLRAAISITTTLAPSVPAIPTPEFP
jgi:hypothetical protein